MEYWYSVLKRNKVSEESTAGKLYDIDLSNDFFENDPKTQVTKEKLVKWYYNKLKSFWTAK